MNSQRKEFAKRYKSITRELGEATLVGVSKYHTFDDIKLAYEVGLRDFGENRVQDLREKSLLAVEEKLDEIRWHFIGHLQSNKINRLLKIPNLVAIHSVDSFKLLKGLYDREETLETDRRIALFLQINTSGEEQKYGLTDYDEISKSVNYSLKHLESSFYLAGLMTMGKIRTDDFEKDAIKSFRLLRDYKNLLEEDFGVDLKLSMGMSRDYHIALQEGADFIRVGSSLFAKAESGQD